MAAYDTGAGASKTNKLQMFFFIVKTQLNHNQVEVGLTTSWLSNPPPPPPSTIHYQQSQPSGRGKLTSFSLEKIWGDFFKSRKVLVFVVTENWNYS